ncbi:benzoate/H(+) symporter BenE family transporter [Brachybacterium sp. J144]|uniref:benzoate/H(+) symporter BenE family transporter n=1 Tax=Brachybacterium sp. J144 TaxID=3116487 RepID=UPI002E76A69F|nr:benzoate/H(+) symporter BenE family transporter [Brachybacterium sp. J144]MEE1649881.1 benzoate/H(+) symporter BenE family transporter [Brachybacterium sp. J144]
MTDLARPVSAGVVAGLVAFTSSFVVVLAGLQAVGASPVQAASGLLAVSVLMGLCSILLSVWSRLPLTIAWSTPGAALLATTGAADGGWPAAVGAFCVVGVLVLLTGLVPALSHLMSRIPTSIAQAMLAGVLLQLCLGPVLGVAANPLAVGPVIAVWALALRLAPRWASPLAFGAAATVIVVSVLRPGGGVPVSALAPRVELTVPQLDPGALVGIALPLYLVTMASQNVPGVAVMRGLGYEVPWRRSMLVTGAGTLVGAPLGGHGVNLAAITAALAAGPEAGEDRSRRWVASGTYGVVLVVLGLGAAAFTQLIGLAPEGVIAAVAGLALISTFVSSLRAALAEPAEQIPAGVTVLIAASGVAVAGISAAFWALLAGLLLRALLHQR